MISPGKFKEKLQAGESIDDDLMMDPEYIEKLGFVLSPDAEDLSKQLWANRRKTWASLLALKSEEKAVEAAGGDESSGETLWGAIVRYREKAAKLAQPSSSADKGTCTSVYVLTSC
jgi:hypothetical protein